MANERIDVLAVMRRAGFHCEGLAIAQDIVDARAAVAELIAAQVAYFADLDAGGEGDQHETRLRIALAAVQS